MYFNALNVQIITPAELIDKLAEVFQLLYDRTLFLQANQMLDDFHEVQEDGGLKKPISTINIIQSITGYGISSKRRVVVFMLMTVKSTLNVFELTINTMITLIIFLRHQGSTAVPKASVPGADKKRKSTLKVCS